MGLLGNAVLLLRHRLPSAIGRMIAPDNTIFAKPATTVARR
jgi:hypothetical protein